MSALISILKELFEKIALCCYDENTIERYFAKKGYKVGVRNKIYVKSLGVEPFLVKIGNYCVITSGVKFINHDGGIWVFNKEKPDVHAFGKIEIKDNCFIGLNSIILPNVSIGPNSVVGAGSIVTKDIPPNSVAAGAPAKVICSLEEYQRKSYARDVRINLNSSRKDLERRLQEYFWKAA